MDLLSVQTLRGKIRYSVCREHVVATCGKLLAGALMVLIAVVYVGSTLIGDPVGSSGGVKFSVLLGIGGAAIFYFALPIRTRKLVEGRHRLHRVHAEVIEEARRAVR